MYLIYDDYPVFYHHIKQGVTVFHMCQKTCVWGGYVNLVKSLQHPRQQYLFSLFSGVICIETGGDNTHKSIEVRYINHA